jgi:crotonobetaine/carnitine-CoA ligase
MLSHRFAIRQAELLIEHLALRDDDVLFSPFPLHHLDAAVLTVMPALVLGTTAALVERFSASRFWDDVRTLGATVFDFMGATITILHEQPRRTDDADNPARLGWGVPMPACAEAFEERFGLELVELYGSTDAGLPIYVPRDEPRRLGSCGKVIAPYEVALAASGELLVRASEPGVMSDGYYRMPEETLASRPDGWFHTGDLLRRDDDGWFWFVGRRAEVIRRRGENISAFEIEEVITLHPAVLEAAAFAVPSELGEDDVMVAVVPRPGRAIDPAELAGWCEQRMARFMVPRFLDVVAELPKTPTEKVAKHLLTARGVSSTTWERP